MKSKANDYEYVKSNFNDLERGLWLPMCLMIFGTDKSGRFSYIDYKKIRNE
jgi:hypothetical protein